MNLDEKLKKRQRLEIKSMYLIEYIYRVLIIKKFLLIPLARSGIHPVGVTAINCIIFPLVLFFIYYHHYILAVVFIQVYAIIDHTDGMLARYTDKKTWIGSRLDRFNDNVFFNVIFIFIAISQNISIYLALMVIICMNLHGFIAMFYLQKELRKLKVIRRFGLKKWFMDRNFILGIDCSLMLSIVSLFLLFGWFQALFFTISFIYVFDILYRIIELKVNQNLDKKEYSYE
ncbi:putative CDP-alcohol phosphatidyltransferase [Campylobacter iguaniorum]|uniref:CDP-alcohol phosphatidyltransferase family protein n=1 Tax=Campylobacter iguaniorum TaxID=1244531 RepID=UPI0007C8A0A7|nr:CDP-alcohol phosphatidyltransferase family protein [Campylobacter iguaniorum]ANE36446.1 putative CDP-alcohol phosphatidyltransferase [Campylobacter iguaniorum]